jgi:EmrB/QacA subfamily drug resistance transporter
MSRRRRLFVLCICCMSLLMVSLDSTIVNVALPAIHRDFNASLSDLQWVIDAYTLVISSFLVLSGSTADRVGRKLIFRVGLGLFTLGSAACAAAPTLGLLIASRVLQALGGSMMNPVALSIVRNVFEDPKERAQAVGIWGATVGISLGLGPVVGGLLVDTVGWRYVFIVNVPVGIIAMVLITMFVPGSKAERARRIDPVGQVLVIMALVSLVYAIIEGPSDGWGSTLIVALFALSVASLITLIFYELRRYEPLIEMRFFRSVPFACATLTALCAFGVFGGFLFLNTLYLQDVRHYSALHAGLMTLPIAAMTLFLAPLSGRLVGRGRQATRIPLVVSGVGIAVGAGLLTQLSTTTADWKIVVAYVIFGAGFGMVNPPITNTAVSGMPPSQSGVAAALASTSRQLGTSLGIAVLGAIAGAGTAVHFGPSYVTATHTAWWIVVALGVAILIIGLVMTSVWAAGTARRTAARLQAPSVANA